MTQSVLHALSVRPRDDGLVEARVTIRTGDPKPGQRLEFTAPDGRRGAVTVESRVDSGKHANLVLSGDTALLEGGFYLLGRAEAA